MTKITKNEVFTIASRYFSVALEEKNKNELLVTALQAQAAARPGVLPACVLDAAAIAAAAVVAATATAAAAADSDSVGEDRRAGALVLLVELRAVRSEVGLGAAQIAIAKITPLSPLLASADPRGAGLSMAAPELYFRS